MEHWKKDGFRPLTGILFFNKKKMQKKVQGKWCFRPLTGILFFNDVAPRDTKNQCAVSVPLRGFCFLISTVLST